ncbi:MAG: NUDIX hydrolase [Planctomycetota bacterium]
MSGKYCYQYPRPAVTVDVVVLSRDGAVLLIKRKNEPFKGRWALPGGFVDEDEPLEAAAARELEEETGLRGVALRQLRAYGDPGRDPRGHTVSVVFLAQLDCRARPRAGSDATEAAWHPTDALPPTAFDHQQIIAHGVEVAGPHNQR